MFRYSSLLVSTFVLLSACATVIDGSTQNIRVETPGAKDSICYLENAHARYKVVPPQTIKITKFKKPFKVNCLASGDRKKSIDINPEMTDSVYYNVANGLIPGLIADDNTNSMFTAPELIVVDFTMMKPNLYPLPDYQHDILQNPTIFQYEEFRPGVPALQSDAYSDQSYELQKTDRAMSAEGSSIIGGSSSSSSTRSSSEGSSSSGSSSSTDGLTRSMNPSVFGGGASNSPEPLK